MLKQLVDNGQEQTTAVTVAGTKEKNHGQGWSRRSFAASEVVLAAFPLLSFRMVHNRHSSRLRAVATGTGHEQACRLPRSHGVGASITGPDLCVQRTGSQCPNRTYRRKSTTAIQEAFAASAL
jgi:hypothetical protein